MTNLKPIAGPAATIIRIDMLKATLYSIAIAIATILVGSGCSLMETRIVGNSGSRVIARSGDYIVLRVGTEDAHALAARYLGDEDRYWQIEDANPPGAIGPGAEIIIPLQQGNTTAVDMQGYQTVPVLCYHRFGDRGTKMTISVSRFREQMQYLKDKGYRVIPLQDLIAFLKGERQIPQRAVVLTVDDGHRSIYESAFPVLKEFGFPATLFLYTDYINNGGLNWDQLIEMIGSGLITVQPHSKTHDNLTLKVNGETQQEYLRRVGQEVRFPKQRLAEQLPGVPVAYAYPFGDANDEVVAALKREGLSVGLTVHSGGNAAFAYPYLLRRSIVFGDRDMEAFKSLLVTYKSISSR